MDSPPAANTRARTYKMTATSSSRSSNGSAPSSPSSPDTPKTKSSPSMTATGARRPPFLPTPIEALALALYPTLLTFGALFSLLSPTVRNAPYDHYIQAHSQEASLSPSYFARKSNLFNVVFVKRGWAWITLAFFAFLFTHPAVASSARRIQGLTRWGLVTAWWVLVTQWCFGPALIDRSFRFTGGKCEVAEMNLEEGVGSKTDFVTGVACKAAGGMWHGGHDISGHVFLLVLGSYFLLQEVGWVYLNHKRRAGLTDERSVVMHDGAVKSAAVEGRRADVDASTGTAGDALGLGGKIAGGVVVLSWWMILMTAIFFHTWVEKLSGLIVSFAGLYVVYFLPRFVPAVRGLVGLPGI